MAISGFTIVRNAQKLNYPFPESVLSALPLCDEFIINCGDSDDNTLAVCESLKAKFPEKIRIIHSKWEKESQSGGYQLKWQTDQAMKECKNEWCLYIQADEAFHEADFQNIRNALKIAEKRPEVDGLVFDYLHFYGSFHYVIRGRNWYRREVRLFKKNPEVTAFRDAQGFRRNGKRLKVIAANARVFHYGYVRSAQSLQQKETEMAKWWGKTPELSRMELKRLVGLAPFKETHPLVMKKRVEEAGDHFNPKNYPRLWNLNELKNLTTVAWESIVPYRIGEFRNYDVI